MDFAEEGIVVSDSELVSEMLSILLVQLSACSFVWDRYCTDESGIGTSKSGANIIIEELAREVEIRKAEKRTAN